MKSPCPERSPTYVSSLRTGADGGGPAVNMTHYDATVLSVGHHELVCATYLTCADVLYLPTSALVPELGARIEATPAPKCLGAIQTTGLMLLAREVFRP